MSNQTAKKSVSLIVILLASSVLGFVREMILAYFYGSSNLTDVYVTAMAISTLLFSGVTSSLVTTYISASAKKKDRLLPITNKILNLAIGAIFILSMLSILLADPLIRIFASGFSAESVALSKQMLYIILPFSVCYPITYLLNGYLQVKNVFWFVGGQNVISNIVLILSIVFSNHSLVILSIGFVASLVLNAVIAVIASRRREYRYQATFNIKEDNIKPMLLLAVPIFIGQLVQQFNLAIDKNFASLISEGIITSMNYATKINNIFITIFIVSTIAIVFPKLSALAYEDRKKFSDTSQTMMKLIVTICIPIAAILSILAYPVVTFLFMRGEFRAEDAQITADMLMIYSLSLPFLGMNELLNKMFYSLEDTKTPIVLSVCAIALNVILNFLWIEHLGYWGLALATVLSVGILTTSLSVVLFKKHRVKAVTPELLKTVLAGVMMTVVLLFIKPHLPIVQDWLIVLSVGLIGLFVYLLLVFGAKIYTISDLKNLRK